MFFKKKNFKFLLDFQYHNLSIINFFYIFSKLNCFDNIKNIFLIISNFFYHIYYKYSNNNRFQNKVIITKYFFLYIILGLLERFCNFARNIFYFGYIIYLGPNFNLAQYTFNVNSLVVEKCKNFLTF